MIYHVLLYWCEYYIAADFFKLCLNPHFTLILVPLQNFIESLLLEHMVHQFGELILITVNMAICMPSAAL